MTRNKVQKIYKMIVLVSDPGELRTTFEQLKVRDILVYPISSVEAAMKIIQSGAVDYCMLSVDNPKIDIYELPQKIENELNVPVIAISELRDKQSMWRLTKVKTKNILYSKANAQNIYQRIQLIRSAQKAFQTKAAQLANLAKLKMAEQERAEARESMWNEQRRKAAEGKNKKIVLLREDKASKVETKVRLLTPPLNKAQTIGTVKLTVETKFRLPPVKTKFTEILNTPVRMLAPLTQKSFYKHLDLVTSEQGPIEFSDIEDGGIAATLRQPEDMQKIMSGCLNNVLSQFCNPNALVPQRNDSYTRSMVIAINSKNLVGTFIIAAQTDVPKLGDVQTQLYDYLRTFGFDWTQDEIKVELLTEQMVPADLITSGVYVAGVSDENEVAIVFYPEAVQVPELGLTSSTQHLLDPKNLVKDTRINFDIYLHLRMNGRDIHYVKIGTEISQRQIEKLQTTGISPFVPREQLKNLNEYVLLQRLLKLVNPDEVDQEIIELLRIS